MLNKRSTLIVLALLLAPFVLAGCSSDNSTTRPDIQSEDTVPPMAPTAWQPKLNYDSAVLRWARNTETDLAGYNVYRYSPNPQAQFSYVVMNSQPIPATFYKVEGLVPGVTYYFKMTAVDMSGNESGYSQLIPVMASEGTQPESPDYGDLSELEGMPR